LNATPRLSIVSFNLKDFFLPTDPTSSAVHERKVASVAALLRAADPDVIALQEVGEEELCLRLLRDELGWREPSLVLGSPDRRGIRCALASRLAVEEQESLLLDRLTFPRFRLTDPEPFAIPNRRSILRTRLETPLGRVSVFTAHFKSQLPTPLKSADGEELPMKSATDWGEAITRSLVQRTAEALALKRFVQQDQAEGRGVLVCGDFNDVPTSVPVAVLLAGDEESRLVDLAAAVPAAQNFTALHRGRPSRIDYVLASTELASRVVEVSISNQSLRDHGPYRPDAPPEPDSDHAPVVVKLG
jgi:endonuclease/exonuclease/phosphatase family metal-dependent hydrolase